MSYDKVKPKKLFERHRRLTKIAEHQQSTFGDSNDKRAEEALRAVVAIRRGIIEDAKTPQEAIETLRTMIAPNMTFQEFSEQSLNVEDIADLGVSWKNELQGAMVALSTFAFDETKAWREATH